MRSSHASGRHRAVTQMHTADDVAELDSVFLILWFCFSALKYYKGLNTHGDDLEI